MSIVEKLRAGGKQPLFEFLVATVDDEKIFNVKESSGSDGGPEDEAFRQKCREVLGYLYEAAAYAWFEMDTPGQCRRPEKWGGQIFEEKEFAFIQGCWIASFRKGILIVVYRKDLAEDRDFLMFMLGMLECGWQECLRQGWFN